MNKIRAAAIVCQPPPVANRLLCVTLTQAHPHLLTHLHLDSSRQTYTYNLISGRRFCGILAGSLKPLWLLFSPLIHPRPWHLTKSVRSEAEHMSALWHYERPQWSLLLVGNYYCYLLIIYCHVLLPFKAVQSNSNSVLHIWWKSLGLLVFWKVYSVIYDYSIYLYYEVVPLLCMCNWKILFSSRTSAWGKDLNLMSAGILVKMLKKEKKRAQDAAAQLDDITNGQSLVSQNASTFSTKPLLREGSTDTTSADQGGQAIQYMKRGILESFILFSHFFTKHFSTNNNHNHLYCILYCIWVVA